MRWTHCDHYLSQRDKPLQSDTIEHSGVPLNPGTVTGSFTASGPITDLTGISNITLAFNGTPLTGHFEAFGFTGSSTEYTWPTYFPLGGAVVSSNPLDNNFFFAAVPEPSTWAMLIAGFAGLGLAGYRRAKTGAIAT